MPHQFIPRSRETRLIENYSGSRNNCCRTDDTKKYTTYFFRNLGQKSIFTRGRYQLTLLAGPESLELLRCSVRTYVVLPLRLPLFLPLHILLANNVRNIKKEKGLQLDGVFVRYVRWIIAGADVEARVIRIGIRGVGT